MSVLNLVWLGIALAVIGGALITLTKFGPRIAVEPVPVGVRGSRFRLTFNGRPAGAFGRPAPAPSLTGRGEAGGDIPASPPFVRSPAYR